MKQKVIGISRVLKKNLPFAYGMGGQLHSSFSFLDDKKYICIRFCANRIFFI
jgi:hypothetical protein